MTELLKNWKERRRTAFIRRELNRYIRCPECRSRRLQAYPFGIYARHFQCAHGHTFSIPIIDDDDLCP